MLLSVIGFTIVALFSPGVEAVLSSAVPLSQGGALVMSVVEVRYVSGGSWLRFESVSGLGALGVVV